MGSEHYFQSSPGVRSEPRTIRAMLRGRSWAFHTDRGVFSPEHIDPGSRLLIEAMEIEPGSAICDLGAGYGPIGLVAAWLAGEGGSVTLVEVNERAAELARRNAAELGIDEVCLATEIPPAARYDVVLTNPPIRAGYKVVKPLLAAGAEALRPGGRLWMVGHKHLGVFSLQKTLAEHLGRVECAAKQGGYRVLVATREAGDA